MDDDSKFDGGRWGLPRLEQQMSARGLDVAALSRREVFYQATGIVMVRHGLDREAAVDFVVDEAERQHCSVDGVARRILDSLTFQQSADLTDDE